MKKENAEMLESIPDKNKMKDKNFPWDVPDKEVPKIANQFNYGKFNRGNIQLPYRLFVSEGKSKIPLVIYLHGAGANGEDNEKQLAQDIAVEFAREEWSQNNPCYILAPQCLKGQAWEMPSIQLVLKALIDEVVQNHPRIDKDRIYLYACSMGSIGGFELIKAHPDYLAGALLICGATSRKGLENLIKTPMWLFHAEDDSAVSIGRMQHPIYKTEMLGSRLIDDELVKLGKANIRYTEYPCNMLHEKYGVKAHCAWILAFETDEAKAWLFSLSNCQ